MTELTRDTFDAGLGVWVIETMTGTTVTISPTAAFQGTNGLLCQTDGAIVAQQADARRDLPAVGVGYPELYYRAYVKFSGSLPNVYGQFWNLMATLGVNWIPDVGIRVLKGTAQPFFSVIYAKNGGTVENPGVDATIDPGLMIALDTWYCVELHAKLDFTGTTSVVDLYIDGVHLVSDSGFQFSDGAAHQNMDKVRVGLIYDSQSGFPRTVMVDNVVTSDSYIGPEGGVPPPSTGTLVVTATKNAVAVAASVSAGGQTGTTPVSFTLAPSTYSVTATYAGVPLTQSAIVTAGQTTSITFDFSVAPNPAFITVNAFSDGTAIVANISADGQSGTTPVTFSFPAGTYSLTATYQGTTLPAQTVTLMAGQTATVNFHFLPATHQLTILVASGGTTNPPPGVLTLDAETVQPVVPLPNSGYRHKSWLFDGINQDPWWPAGSTIYITMDADHTVQPVFELIPPTQYTLTLATTAGGTTNPIPGTYLENAGTTIGITAVPNSSYAFDHWDLDGVSYTTNAISVLMDKNHSLTAYFIRSTITLTIVAGSGGSVSPSGTQVLTIGQSYSIAAIPNTGYQLEHWDLSGANQGSTNPITIVATLSMDLQTFTGIFTTIPPQQITLNIATSGNGNVNLANGSHTFNVGDRIQFIATPNADSAFSQWTMNGTIYTRNPLNLQIILGMNGQTLTATFRLTTIWLTVTSGANGSVSPSGIIALLVGQPYLFMATPNAGYLFDHWDLGGANIGSSNPLTLTATEDMNAKTLTALFTIIPPVQITLTLRITGNGVTNPTAGQQTFNVGDSITFSAIPNAGQSFTKWTLDGTTYTDNPLTLQITQDLDGKTITAEFTGPPILAGFPIWTIPVTIIGLGAIYLATRKK